MSTNRYIPVKVYSSQLHNENCKCVDVNGQPGVNGTGGAGGGIVYNSTLANTDPIVNNSLSVLPHSKSGSSLSWFQSILDKTVHEVGCNCTTTLQQPCVGPRIDAGPTSTYHDFSIMTNSGPNTYTNSIGSSNTSPSSPSYFQYIQNSPTVNNDEFTVRISLDKDLASDDWICEDDLYTCQTPAIYDIQYDLDINYSTVDLTYTFIEINNEKVPLSVLNFPKKKKADPNYLGHGSKRFLMRLNKDDTVCLRGNFKGTVSNTVFTVKNITQV